MPEAKYSWSGGFCMEVVPLPNVIVIFGASGDLACRKLLPALFHLYQKGLLHKQSRILGCARTNYQNEEYRNLIATWLNNDSQQARDFLETVYYASGDYRDITFYRRLDTIIGNLEKDAQAEPGSMGRLFYLAMPSTLYTDIVDMLGQAELTRQDSPEDPPRHVVLEKPFGRDLTSAQELDRHLHQTLKEYQIYRIDHYLGKETVQNIFILRFANIIFEQVWNAQFIDNVQITVAEKVGVEQRAGYFDQSGLLRDMFQNHILEMLALVAMENPGSIQADAIRNEKLKLLKAIRPFTPETMRTHIVRAQYRKGTMNGKEANGYLDEKDIPQDSQTETFVAMKIFIDNWRWHGVPFYLRSGKRLQDKVSKIVINFKKIPHSIFAPIKAEALTPNQLVLMVQPQEGIKLTIQAKQPGPKLCMGALGMDFKYASLLEPGETMPDAYERLLLDCMLGDQTLFIRNDTIEHAWKLMTPILEQWKNSPETMPLHTYQAGSWGPEQADKLIQNDAIEWQNED